MHYSCDLPKKINKFYIVSLQYSNYQHSLTFYCTIHVYVVILFGDIYTSVWSNIKSNRISFIYSRQDIFKQYNISS